MSDCLNNYDPENPPSPPSFGTHTNQDAAGNADAILSAQRDDNQATTADANSAGTSSVHHGAASESIELFEDNPSPQEMKKISALEQHPEPVQNTTLHFEEKEEKAKESLSLVSPFNATIAQQEITTNEIDEELGLAAVMKKLQELEAKIATQNSLAKGQEKEVKEVKKSKDIVVPVSNFCLIKHLNGDGEGNLTLVGTLIQYVFDTHKSVLHTAKEPSFKYRFNDLTSDDSTVQSRRLEDYRKEKKATRETFQMSAPLEVNVVFDKFPFKIVTASLLIELSTTFDDEHEKRLRPNLLLAKKDRRNNIAVQSPYQGIEIDGGKEEKTIEKLKDKMDKMKCFDLITPFPKIEYFQDTKKNYCPKFKMTFYLTEEGSSKLVAIIAPMLLISTLNTLHVFNPDKPDTVDFIANAATFALTAVFILPSIVTRANRTSLFTSNNGYILLVFLGLALSSFPEQMVGTQNYAVAGVALFWLSFLIPFIHAIQFWDFQRKLSPTGGKLRIKDFISDDDFKPVQYNIEKHDYDEHFNSTQRMAESGQVDTLYHQRKRNGNEKFRIFEYLDWEKKGFFDREKERLSKIVKKGE